MREPAAPEPEYSYTVLSSLVVTVSGLSNVTMVNSSMTLASYTFGFASELNFRFHYHSPNMKIEYWMTDYDIEVQCPYGIIAFANFIDCAQNTYTRRTVGATPAPVPDHPYRRYLTFYDVSRKTAKTAIMTISMPEVPVQGYTVFDCSSEVPPQSIVNQDPHYVELPDIGPFIESEINSSEEEEDQKSAEPVETRQNQSHFIYDNPLESYDPSFLPEIDYE